MCTFEELLQYFQNPKTPDQFTKFSFAKGLAKGKLGGVVDVNRQLNMYKGINIITNEGLGV